MIKVTNSTEEIVRRIPIVNTQKSIPLWECVNIVADSDGYFYGIYKDRIYIYDTEGNPISSFGKYGTDSGELKQATQIVVDTNKSIYVVDPGNNRITKFDIK